MGGRVATDTDRTALHLLAETCLGVYSNAAFVQANLPLPQGNRI